MVERALWQIEMRLNAPLTLCDLAALCSVSPHHFARTFRLATGVPPMAYLRRRRLSVAAARLADGAADILSIALDAQYASHEAFTRAFVEQFGVTPSAVRGARSLNGLNLTEPIKMNRERLVEIAAPAIRSRGAFRAIGLGADCTAETINAIPPLWEAFNAREGEVDTEPGAVAYGVCFNGDGSGSFRYLAGIEARADAGVPDGMEAVAIPAARYAVFTHSGHVSDLPGTVYTIWNKALPEAGLTAGSSPDFELYDRRFDPATGRGEVEIWIPLAD